MLFSFSVIIIPYCAAKILANKNINKSAQFLLVNFMITETFKAMSSALFYWLQQPSYPLYQDNLDDRLKVNLICFEATQMVLATCMIAINIIIWFKYGRDLKWATVIFTIVASTLITSAIAIAIIDEQANIRTLHTREDLLERHACVRAWLFVLMFQVAQSTFMIVITKLVTLDDNAAIRKAVNKALLHLFAASVMSFTVSLLPVIDPALRVENEKIPDIVAYLIVIPAFTTPFVTTILVKPAYSDSIAKSIKPSISYLKSVTCRIAE